MKNVMVGYAEVSGVQGPLGGRTVLWSMVETIPPNFFGRTKPGGYGSDGIQGVGGWDN